MCPGYGGKMIHRVLEWLDEPTAINKPVSTWKLVVAQLTLALTVVGLAAIYLIVISLPVIIGLLIAKTLGII
jgi:hypothetical protein